MYLSQKGGNELDWANSGTQKIDVLCPPSCTFQGIHGNIVKRERAGENC